MNNLLLVGFIFLISFTLSDIAFCQFEDVDPEGSWIAEKIMIFDKKSEEQPQVKEKPLFSAGLSIPETEKNNNSKTSDDSIKVGGFSLIEYDDSIDYWNAELPQIKYKTPCDEDKNCSSDCSICRNKKPYDLADHFADIKLLFKNQCDSRKWNMDRLWYPGQPLKEIKNDFCKTCLGDTKNNPKLEQFFYKMVFNHLGDEKHADFKKIFFMQNKINESSKWINHSRPDLGPSLDTGYCSIASKKLGSKDSTKELAQMLNSKSDFKKGSKEIKGINRFLRYTANAKGLIAANNKSVRESDRINSYDEEKFASSFSSIMESYDKNIANNDFKRIISRGSQKEKDQMKNILVHLNRILYNELNDVFRKHPYLGMKFSGKANDAESISKVISEIISKVKKANGENYKEKLSSFYKSELNDTSDLCFDFVIALEELYSDDKFFDRIKNKILNTKLHELTDLDLALRCKIQSSGNLKETISSIADQSSDDDDDFTRVSDNGPPPKRVQPGGTINQNSYINGVIPITAQPTETGDFELDDPKELEDPVVDKKIVDVQESNLEQLHSKKDASDKTNYENIESDTSSYYPNNLLWNGNDVSHLEATKSSFGKKQYNEDGSELVVGSTLLDGTGVAGLGEIEQLKNEIAQAAKKKEEFEKEKLLLASEIKKLKDEKELAQKKQELDVIKRQAQELKESLNKKEKELNEKVKIANSQNRKPVAASAGGATNHSSQAAVPSGKTNFGSSNDSFVPLPSSRQVASRKAASVISLKKTASSQVGADQYTMKDYVATKNSKSLESILIEKLNLTYSKDKVKKESVVVQVGEDKEYIFSYDQDKKSYKLSKIKTSLKKVAKDKSEKTRTPASIKSEAADNSPRDSLYLKMKNLIQGL